MLSMMEAVTGTMYMAVLVARLVSGFSFNQPTAEESRPPGQT